VKNQAKSRKIPVNYQGIAGQEVRNNHITLSASRGYRLKSINPIPISGSTQGRVGNS
jgi:hypothetical protein